MRYAIIGLGGRCRMYVDSLLNDYRNNGELVAIADSNPGRVKLMQSIAKSKGVDVLVYSHAQFDQMVTENEISTVIVTTKDRHHDEYICRAMELGADVITEKPMTTDQTKCRRILDVQKQTGRRCRVTFNYRYAPPRSQLKELLMSGVIGRVASIDFHWLLNTRHGADYFRRWHRNKANSGGLMVHKATHHFDLVNWWLSSVPVSVYASGHRSFYLPERRAQYGIENPGERCLDCPEASKCPFHLDLRGNPDLKETYLDNESYDGYFRDRCVFSADIDIEDTMSVVVNYASGAQMSYSLHAFAPWEGFLVSFNGTKGRIEHICQESVYVNGDGSVPGELVPEGTKTRIYPHFLSPYEVEVWTGEGGHGGGDPVMLNDLFGSNPPTDKYLRAADQRAGAWSIMTGIAANVSIKTGKAVTIKDLVGEIDFPDYPSMPDPFQPYTAADRDVLVEAERGRR